MARILDRQTDRQTDNLTNSQIFLKRRVVMRLFFSSISDKKAGVSLKMLGVFAG